MGSSLLSVSLIYDLPPPLQRSVCLLFSFTLSIPSTCNSDDDASQSCQGKGPVAMATWVVEPGGTLQCVGDTTVTHYVCLPCLPVTRGKGSGTHLLLDYLSLQVLSLCIHTRLSGTRTLSSTLPFRNGKVVYVYSTATDSRAELTEHCVAFPWCQR